MNKQFTISGVLVLGLFLASCEKILLKPNPETDNQAIFEEYATLVQEKYAMLDSKGIQFQSLRDSLSATITNDLSEAELFQRLGVITQRLKDGHSSLAQVTEDGNGPVVTFDILKGYPTGFDRGILFNNYVGAAVNPGMQTLAGDEAPERAMWGTLPQDPGIGYLWIPTWNEEISEEEIETIFKDLSATRAMIVDQRLNQGGDPNLAVKFASYFINEPLYTGFERFKTGPGNSDFHDSQITMEPADSDNRYLKPIVILTDRNVYSAGLTFTYSLSPLDRVTFIGQRSGGGSGGVADGYLANGWAWSLSVTEFIDHKNRYLDDGLDPDIPVSLDLSDPSKDEVLERAILELQ